MGSKISLKYLETSPEIQPRCASIPRSERVQSTFRPVENQTNATVTARLMNFAPPPNRRLYFDQIWAQAREIPHGRVATYGQLTKLVPRPEGTSDDDYKSYASRWAGLAMAACPDDVPWHRVVNSQGKISHPAAAEQRRRLESEGVVFSNDKLSLAEYQCREPGQSDEPTQSRLFD